MSAELPSLAAVPPDVVSVFAPTLVAWQRHSGRHGLPWQGSRDPYRVWLSEIMLQQTQVATVLSYYPRFLARFPDVHALAAASVDEVMALWSGLGYYSRARNLHRCAQRVVQAHGGVFPAQSQALAELPGIGASTAAAIAAFCHGEPVSIADGNVRRVLARVLAMDDDMSLARSQQRLWQVAQQLVPPASSPEEMQAYTQGLMDLGATVCTRTRPACDRCPMQAICRGHRQGNPVQYPVKTRRVARRHESWWLLILLRDTGDGPTVWLESRPSPGIWAGLQCVPVFDNEASARLLLDDVGMAVQEGDAMSHALTHRELRLHPLWVTCTNTWQPAREGRWLPLARLADVGLPTPVRSLLQQLR